MTSGATLQPRTEMEAGLQRRDWARLALLVGVTVVIRLAIAAALPARALANDFRIWDTVTNVLLSGGNPYATSHGLLYYPPFWMQILFILGELSNRIHVSLSHLIQCLLTAVDAGTVVVAYLFARSLGMRSRAFWLVLIGIALNPISVILTCQHGNFDSIVGFFVLVSAYALVVWNRRASISTLLLSCLALGLGILAKTVPLILTPFLATRWRDTDWTSRVVGLALVLGPTALAVSIVYVLSPQQVVADIFRYRSAAGYFGITGLLNLAGRGDWVSRYGAVYPVLASAVLIGAGLAISRARRLDDLTIVLGYVLLLMWIPAFGSGYGPQYIAWFLPLAVILFGIGDRRIRLGLAAFGVVAVATYLVEYAFIPSQGASFRLIAPDVAASIGNAISRPKAQTLVRLPLFLSYLAFIAIGVITLLRSPVFAWDRLLGRDQTVPDQGGAVRPGL